MFISVDLVETDAEIVRRMLDALAVEVNRYLVIKINTLKPKITNVLEDALFNCPEVQSLLGGQLQAELGVPDSDLKLDSLIRIWARSIDIKLSPAKRSSRNGITGGFVLTAIKADYSDVLSTDDAIYTTSNNQVIEWLRWLLLEGDRRIIRGYQIGGDLHNKSRTGLGRLMWASKQGRSWGVPPQFAGTKNNNFVTRTIDDIEQQLDLLIQDHFT